MSFGIHSVAKQSVISINLNTKNGIQYWPISFEHNDHPQFVVSVKITLPCPVAPAYFNFDNLDRWFMSCFIELFTQQFSGVQQIHVTRDDLTCASISAN